VTGRPDEAPLVEARGVSVRFGRSEVLSGIDLAVRPGEIVTLLGPNGAGKTTLVRCLLGLLRPDAGSVRRRPGLAVGYLPQRTEIDDVLPLTVDRLLRLARRAGPGDIARALAEVGASALAGQGVHTLSGGELQRVLLARALLRDPDLLVLDEPVQNVDVTGQAELYDLVSRIRARRGCGVLLISHDLHLVMAATDHVVCINRHLCCSGRPEAVSRHPEYVEMFGAREARSLAVYTHDHDHHHDLTGGIVPHRPEGAPPARREEGRGEEG